MVQYNTHALAALLLLTVSSSTCNGFLSPTPSRCRLVSTSIRRNVSASTPLDDSSSNANDDTSASLRDAVENLSASMNEAIYWDDTNDVNDEANLQRKKKRMQQRLGIRTVPLQFANDSTTIKNIGVRLGQVEPGFLLLDKTLDVDTLKYYQQQQQQQDDDSLLKKSVDAKFRGVVVLSVQEDSQGWEAGIRPGDVLTASSATMGDAMWPKKTLEGVQSAIASRKVVSATLDLQFQQQQKDETGVATIDNQYELSLSRPIGIEVGEDSNNGYVVVTGFNTNASKLVRNAVLPGDRIVAVASSLGDRLWPVSTVEGVISACTARLPGQKVTMRFERPQENLIKAAALAEAATKTTTVASTTTTALPSTAVDIMTQTAVPMSPEKRKRLLNGCREVLRRYPAAPADDFVGKYDVPAMVADKVVDAVASASTSFDAMTLSMVMNAFLSCDQADGAIRIFEAATGIKADGSSSDAIVETIIVGKDKGALLPSSECLNLYTASSLMRALAKTGNVSSAKRVLAALEGRGGTIVDEKEVATWPGAIVPDAMCYNIALKAASTAGALSDLLAIFTRMSDVKDDIRPAKDIVSYNTVIVALTNAGRTEDAFDMFSRMKKVGMKPDKFTYTSLIKACSRPIDMQELLYDMKEKGVAPDIVTYNTMIRTLCDRLQWYEAKKLIVDMESSGIAPNSMTYSFLMSGLMKAEKYSAALILFESACADMRTTPLTENVQLYTSAITAAACLKNHNKAFNLVNRMHMAGVRPNLQTMTAVMCSCLSSGVPNLAVDVYKKIDKPDGIAMSKGLEAMGYEGMFDEVATALYEQWKNRGNVMSGKQIMDGYNQLLRQTLEQGDLAFARKALTQFLAMGFIPSKKMYHTVIEALQLVPPKKKDLPFAKTVPEENFDFLLFVLDVARSRNLTVDGLFYSSLLATASRMGPLRRKLGSLMAEARALSTSDAALVNGNSNDDDNNNDELQVLGWEDFLHNYDAYKQSEKTIRRPRLSVSITKALTRTVLVAEQLVTYNGVRKSSSRKKSFAMMN